MVNIKRKSVECAIATGVLLLGGGILRIDAGNLPSRDPVINLCPSGMFAMTFDQGPGISTGMVLDALMDHKVKATFHPVVSFLDEVTVVANLQRAAKEGHLIGLSIEDSLDLSDLSKEGILDAINARAEVIKSIIGYKPVYLRISKYKELSADTIQYIIDKGYIISTYNIDSYDYSTKDILGQYKATLEKLSPHTKGGFIGVQRDLIDDSAAATDNVIAYILEKGYKLVTMDECAKGKVKNPPGPKGLGPIKGRDTSGASAMSSSSLWTLGSAVVGTLAYLLA